MRKLLTMLTCGCLLLSFAACGGTESDPSASDSLSTSSVSDLPTDAGTDTSSAEDKKLTSEEVLAAEAHLVGLCDQVHGRIIVCDLAEEDWTDDNAVVWEYKYQGNGHIAGIKFRHCDYWGGDVVIFCTPGAAVILSYETKELLLKTSDIGWNPHSVELLPDGTFIVASSTDNLVSVFAPGKTLANQTLEFPNAHGVLWDPAYGVLWMVGMDQLSAYTVSGNPQKPVLKAVTTMDYRSPQAGMHDLAPLYGDPESLLITCSAGIMRFDKEEGTFDYGYSGGTSGKSATYAPGCGTFEDGVFVYTSVVSGQTVYQDWCTNVVNVYVPLGEVRGKLLKRKAPDDAYYKVRVWCTDYQ